MFTFCRWMQHNFWRVQQIKIYTFSLWRMAHVPKLFEFHFDAQLPCRHSYSILVVSEKRQKKKEIGLHHCIKDEPVKIDPKNWIDGVARCCDKEESVTPGTTYSILFTKLLYFHFVFGLMVNPRAFQFYASSFQLHRTQTVHRVSAIDFLSIIGMNGAVWQRNDSTATVCHPVSCGRICYSLYIHSILFYYFGAG